MTEKTQLTADLIRARLVAMHDLGRGESAESLAKIFSLPLDDVKRVLGIRPPPAPAPRESVLDRMFSHLKRRG